MHPEALGALVRALGVPTVPARVGVIRQRVLEMPAPVVADALGYHHKTVTRAATQAADSWSRYTAGRGHPQAGHHELAQSITRSHQ
jgi:hypothetical protein